ncbi:hypothetical protein ECMP0209401_0444 [Escherichia coli MP020940.1]|uniref:Uncharacterized protein n=2 Tax=Escherichia coli TaxID=562 RepID=A0AAJ1ART4_ECOLX|nr:MULTISPECIES: hypothetical protein [Enterobacteriaceae]AKH25288.1 hypothetical protein AA102_15840 [Escherichia coli]AUL66945.1 hypothetical protein BVL39_01595 [Escherichia coli]AVN07929.1 hypothetical protein CSC11_1901 [Escherichia coli]AWF15301.1 hypothetical protein CSC23_1895 [Escherichia coli]AWK00698.1 hypothetical protein C7235_19650 [Escherichia coli]
MLELNVSRLSNVVTFQVDRPSLEKAKAEVEKLRKQMAAVKDIELRVKTHKQSTAKAKKDVDDIAKKQAQADKANAKAQLAAQRVVAREQKALAARKEKAELKLLDVGSSISAMHRLSVAEQYKAIAQAREIALQYERGAISLARMNSQMKRLQQQQRKINGNRNAHAKAYAPVKGSGSIGGGAAAVMLGGLGAGATYMAMSKASEFVTNSFANAETLGELYSRAKLGGVDVNQMNDVEQWAYKNGVDSMMGEQGKRKYLDQMKDVRERATKSYDEAEYVVDKKTGKGEWKGGDSGINTLMNEGFLTKKDLKDFADNPAGLVSKAVQGMVAKGYSDAQIGSRLEDLADDLMLTSKYWTRSAKEVEQSAREQRESGRWVTQAQQESVIKFRELNNALSGLSDSQGIAFVDGFMKSLDPAVIEEFKKSMVAMLPMFTKLGEAIGGLVNAVMKAINWLMKNDEKTEAIQKNLGDAPPLSNEGMKQNLSNLVPDQYKGAGTGTTKPDNSNSLFNTIKGWFTPEETVGGAQAVNQYTLEGQNIANLKQSAAQQAIKTPSYTFAPVINFNPELQVNAEVPLTIESDTGRLSEFIDFKSKASSAEFSKLLTLGVMSGGSTY